MREAIPDGSSDLTVLAVRRLPFEPEGIAMLMLFAFAIATMIAVLGAQSMLKVVVRPVPLRSR